MHRTLRLNRETLTELSTDDLALVAGARPTTWSVDQCFTLPLRPCFAGILATRAC